MLAGLVRPAGPGEPLVSLTVTGDEAAIAAAARITVFRTAQEALTNARKHAAACRVSMTVAFGDHDVRLVVSDDGCGFDPAAGLRTGFGLPGMRERAALAGGRAEVASSPGEGTTVTVIIPRFAVGNTAVTAPASTVPA
jgi:signal transduction histidine kinase